MADNGLTANNFLNDRLDIEEGRSILEINWFDTSDPLAIVNHLTVIMIVVRWFDQSVENNIAIKVDDRDSGKLFPIFSENPLTIKGKNLSLFSSLITLVEHIVKHDRLIRSYRLH
jgi:hypothetical protein